MRFLVYLWKKGHIDNRTAMSIVDQLENGRPPLGQLALQHKMLSIKQLMHVLNHQVASDTHAPLGAVAVSLGYLTEDQVNELLLIQKEETPDLTRLLVEAGMGWHEVHALRGAFVGTL